MMSNRLGLKNNKLQVLFLGLLILGLTSCHKKLVPQLPKPPKAIDIQQIDFEYLHGKARLAFRDNNKEEEVKAHIRIRKDSVIWMKLTVIGVQGGAVLVNKDSITIVANMKKEYYVFKYEDLSKKFNFKINYDMIQSALLGNPIILRRPEDQIEEETFFNKLIQQQGTLTLENLINKNTKKVEHINMTEAGTGNTAKITYADFQPVGDKLFPYKGTIDVTYKAIQGILKNTIVFEYIKAEVGTRELRFPFNIPRRYERR
ncbi:MAG: hypothetical protein OJF59_001316 [Cytophagales bacterium]|jgi:hypothetical protein|nr:DUF4292 domain-containing protein [Bacteroidota bacterium]WHZ07563.1 MAG: hypothetical protein OJF59_001316 [Cytophagales bacterium]